MIPKQKIMDGRGLSNLNPGIFVSSFDVCRASKPFPSIKYDRWQVAQLLEQNNLGESAAFLISSANG